MNISIEDVDKVRPIAALVAHGANTEAHLVANEAIQQGTITTKQQAIMALLWGAATNLQALCEVYSKQVGQEIDPVGLLKASIELNNKNREINRKGMN